MAEPWTEKYRPKSFNEIVLSDENRTFIENMIKKDEYPNMIFYGTPGTGKTTTILCLIESYQSKHNCKNNYIHLNASHERGVDTIRNDIYNFSKTKMFYDDKQKFVLLDEVDSMTKQAQKQLYSLIKQSEKNICFILICNFMNKIITSIQNSLITLTFKCISSKSDEFLNNCIKNEDLKISENHLESLKNYYKHDLRSIVNALQNYDGYMEIVQEEEIMNLLDSNKPANILTRLLKRQDFSHILYSTFDHVYRHYEIDKKLITMMKYLLFVNQSKAFFISEFIPEFKLKNKLI